MPKGPQGQHRPADVVGCAVHVARLPVGLETGHLRGPAVGYTKGNLVRLEANPLAGPTCLKIQAVRTSPR